MGISDIRVSDTTEVEIVHPKTGEVMLNEDDSPMTVTVHGPYSAKYKKINRDQTNRRLQKAQRGGGKMNMTAEELEGTGLELLVKCVEDWNISIGDEKEPFSADAVRTVFTEHPWVRAQVEEVFADEKSFLD